MGPHTSGNEQCEVSTANVACQRGGRFLGFGGNLELRARLWRFLYVNGRVMAVANVIMDRPLYDGLVAPAFGLGVYGKHLFFRGEYMLALTLGDNRFAPPLSVEKTAKADWKPHAGTLSAGFRWPFTPRISGEAWVGFVMGPRERREVQNVVENRTLLSFLVGLGISYDLIAAGKRR